MNNGIFTMISLFVSNFSPQFITGFLVVLAEYRIVRLTDVGEAAALCAGWRVHGAGSIRLATCLSAVNSRSGIRPLWTARNWPRESACAPSASQTPTGKNQRFTAIVQICYSKKGVQSFITFFVHQILIIVKVSVCCQ